MQSRPNGPECLGGASGKQRPDIVIRHPGGLPVATETEFTPARSVEQEAIARPGKTVDSEPVEGALAAGILDRPIGSQAVQGEAICNARFEFCLYSSGADAVAGWPRGGLAYGNAKQPGQDGKERSPVGDPPGESGRPAAGADPRRRGHAAEAPDAAARHVRDMACTPASGGQRSDRAQPLCWKAVPRRQYHFEYSCRIRGVVQDHDSFRSSLQLEQENRSMASVNLTVARSGVFRPGRSAHGIRDAKLKGFSVQVLLGCE